MERPRICAVIIDNNPEAVREVSPFVDLFEIRMDCIGDNWPGLVKQFEKPWIACNRSASEGGRWEKGETRRIDELLKATELGADIIDIELETRDLEKVIPLIKERARCLLSFHDLKGTPSFDSMREIVQRQIEAGADICKMVTTAQSFEDNLTVLQLISALPSKKLISFAMGQLGLVSRILCPLIGGDFIYASMEKGRESAPGQITARELRKLYQMMGK